MPQHIPVAKYDVMADMLSAQISSGRFLRTRRETTNDTKARRRGNVRERGDCAVWWKGGHGIGGYIAWILSGTGRRLLLLLLTSDEICLGQNDQTLAALNRLSTKTASRIGTINQTHENMEPLLLVNSRLALCEI